MREIILMRIEREIMEETLEILERITTLVILDINHDQDQDQILGRDLILDRTRSLSQDLTLAHCPLFIIKLMVKD
jgi:hypothetical protein